MKKIFLIFICIIIISFQGLHAQTKNKVLKFSGKTKYEKIEKLLNSILKNENNRNNLYILDFSKTVCYEWNEEHFFFECTDNRIQGVILPESVSEILRCDCPDLKFVQLSNSTKIFPCVPFKSTTLRFIFITGKDKSDTDFFDNCPVRDFNSAKIIYQDCFEYAKANKISLYKLNAAEKENDYNLFIPPEKVTVSSRETDCNNIYSIIETTEESERRCFNVQWIKLKNEDTGLSENEIKAYEATINKMNEFISWNSSNFYNKMVAFSSPYNYRKYFTSSLEKITSYGSYISIACYFSYDTGFPHETHEYKSFCYDTKTKSFVNLSEASGWSEKQLHEVILNADFDDGFNVTRERLDLDFDTIKNLSFKFLEDGRIKILFSDYIFDRYSHEYVIERKK